ENGYQRFLTYALNGKRPYGFLIGTFSLLIVSVILLGSFPPKVDFFPVNEPQYLNIFIEKPIGPDIEETNRTTVQLENTVMTLRDKYFTTDEEGNRSSYLIESVIAQVGEGASDPSQGSSAAQTPHKSRITVQFSKFQNRQGISTGDVLEEIRQELKGYPGTQ